MLRGKIICGCGGGKMQRRKGSGNAEWHFFTCISNNRLGNGHCTGMYIRESEIMDAIFREVRAFIKTNVTSTSTYKNESALLTAKAKHLDGEINRLMAMNKNRYEDFVMGIADTDDLQQCRDEREALQAELQDINCRIEVLDRKNQQYQLFCDVLNDKQTISRFVVDYLLNISVLDGGRVDIQFV